MRRLLRHRISLLERRMISIAPIPPILAWRPQLSTEMKSRLPYSDLLLFMWGLFAISPTSSFAKEPSHELTVTTRQFGVAEGLSQRFVYCSFQDHLGIMWFGTRDGLDRFDGYTFTSYHY